MESKIYPHDRLLAATLLKCIPSSVTPNQITIVRLCLTPFVVLFLALRQYEIGIPFFLFAALTDLIDGSLARTRRQVTQWGIIWDPVADKLLIGSVAVLFLFRGFPVWLAGTVLGFEAAFLIGGYIRKRHGKITGANWWGKMKMVCQVFAVACYLFALQGGVPGAEQASFALFGLSSLLALCSLLAYGL